MTSKNSAVPCEIYTRCVGYFRPVSQFNPGKKSEYNERVNYALPVITVDAFKNEKNI